MPNKTIYIPKNLIPIWDKIQNKSAWIALMLRSLRQGNSK